MRIGRGAGGRTGDSALFLLGLLAGSAPQVEAAGLFLGGSFTAPFWVLVVGLGIVVPLIIQLLAARHVIEHTPVAPLLVMAGGLALRWVIVSAGQVSRLGAWGVADSLTRRGSGIVRPTDAGRGANHASTASTRSRQSHRKGRKPRWVGDPALLLTARIH